MLRRTKCAVLVVWVNAFVLSRSFAAGPTAAAGPNWLSEFVQALNPNSPAGEIVVRTRPDSLVHALAAYFRYRRPPNAPWVLRTSLETSKLKGLEAADAAVRHVISEYGTEQFGDTLPWFDSNKKVGTIARFPHFHPLAQAYLATHDEKYARAMVRDMLDFVQHVPIEKARGYSPYDEYHSNPWNWVLLQWRLQRWIDALWILHESPSLSDTAYLKILNHLWKEVDWLTPRIDLGLFNGTLGNLQAVLYAAATFPEARHARRWREEGTRQFACFVDHYFYPGEVSIELTLGYSSSVLAKCLVIVDRLPRGFLPPALLSSLESILDGHVGLMKPDRSLPRYGDHGNYDIRKSLLTTGARVFRRSDLAALSGTQPAQDSLPAFLSFPPPSRTLYRDGYYAMRDGWLRTSQFFFIDAGPFGTNHQHADHLSFCVSADGADFVVDPGTAIYRSTQPGPRFDLRFGFLHNVVTLNGVDPGRGWMSDYMPGPRHNHWVTSPSHDFLEANHHFQPQGLGVVWWRSVFYRKGEYWLLLDWLQGVGQYTVESNMQCALGNRVAKREGGVVIAAPDGAKLAVVCADCELQPTVVTGDTVFPGTRYPLGVPWVDWQRGGRGWIGAFGLASPLDATRCYPAPAVVWRGNVELPHLSVYLLVPSHGGRFPAKSRLRWLVQEPDSAVLEVRASPGVVDWFGWCRPEGEETSQRRVFSRSFWVRLVGGRPVEAVLLNRRFLSLETAGGTLEVGFSSAVSATLVREGKRWSVRLDVAPHNSARLLRLSWKRGGKVRNWVNEEGIQLRLGESVELRRP